MITGRCRIFVFIFLLVSCVNKRRDGKIPVAKLKEDFTILRTSLEEMHPGLYWYTPKQEMNNCFDSAYALLKEPVSSLDFFKLLMPVIARIRCVHTSVIPSREGLDSAASHFLRLPLSIYCIDGKAFIRECFEKGYEDLKGQELVAVNNHPVNKILPIILNALPADGYNETFKYHLLQTTLFSEGYALFFDQPKEFIITTTDKFSRKKITHTLPAISQRELAKSLKPKPQLPDLHLLIDGNTAVMEVNTFEPSSTSAFRDTVRTYFKAISDHHITKLIIDVRKNGGGNNGNVTDLFAYIADSAFLHIAKAEMISQHPTYLRYINNQEDFKRLHGIKTAEGYYDMGYRYPGAKIKDPVSDFHYGGKTIVLAGGGTVSAASEFVSLVHSNKRAIIIGEEIAGCYYGATGGNYMQLVLPNSHVKIIIPTIRIRIAVKKQASQPEGHGVFPDITCVPSIEDVLIHRDVVLEKAKALK